MKTSQHHEKGLDMQSKQRDKVAKTTQGSKDKVSKDFDNKQEILKIHKDFESITITYNPINLKKA